MLKKVIVKIMWLSINQSTNQSVNQTLHTSNRKQEKNLCEFPHETITRKHFCQ